MLINLALKIEKRIQSVDVYEENGVLIINFGKIYMLETLNNPDEMDDYVIHFVMSKIAELLPERMRGSYI